ncbi:ATP-binding protein [Methanococcoides methylutens]|uniref:Uncharacterized protein n=1 Tax=Methanococcoides methylutens MM1 TaxID=1434104 RepID=A0A0E3WZ57_METMT|nr:ATP-binding protein [Methanococcoides methylutens]AKB84104.1 hypothetical protein MCMEM_0051 [Methanococcoides methylutens MM1]
MDVSLGKGALSSNYQGFQKITSLYKKIKTIENDDELIIDMPWWFDANMCAPLGSILLPILDRNIPITLNCTSAVTEILQKNKFLPKFGFNVPSRPDYYDSTIEYIQFDANDEYKRYVNKHFQPGIHGMPKMGDNIFKEFRGSLYEIFGNSVFHSETKQIFSCGQYFHRQNRLDFSIVDLGIGFHGNIKKKIDLDLSPKNAIAWAMEEDQTTRKGSCVPGGLGLKRVKRFIEANGGKMQIITYNGFWEFSKDRPIINTFKDNFPGTIVNIEINTSNNTPHFIEYDNDCENIF